MYRKLLPLFLVFLLLSACSTPAPPSPDELVDVYLSMIDTLFNEDTALNGDKFIAVDTSGMTNLDRAAKDRILKGMEKYGRIVLEEGLDGLEAKGYIKDLRFENGVLFILKDKPPASGIIAVDAEKWQSGAGADFCTFDVKKEDSIWKIVKRYNNMIS